MKGREFKEEVLLMREYNLDDIPKVMMNTKLSEDAILELKELSKIKKCSISIMLEYLMYIAYEMYDYSMFKQRIPTFDSIIFNELGINEIKIEQIENIENKKWYLQKIHICGYEAIDHVISQWNMFFDWNININDYREYLIRNFYIFTMWEKHYLKKMNLHSIITKKRMKK